MAPANDRVSWIRAHRLALSVAGGLFLALVGTGVANATWVASPAGATASVASGTIGVAQSGFANLAFVYTSSALTVTKPVTVTNTGTITAPYTLTLGAQAANALATGTTVRVWIDATAGCATPAGASYNWTTVPAQSGTLAPGATAVYCISSTITQPQRFSLVAASDVATATATSTIGNWTSSASATASQSVANTLTPGTPTVSAVTDRGATLTWTKPSDIAAVTGFQVFRDGVLIATTSAATTSFADTGLSVGPTYTYTIKAVDAATPSMITTSWYKVMNTANGGLCVDAEGNSTANGTPVISWVCKATGFDNQMWQFVPTGGGYYRVVTKNALRYWDTSVGSDAEIRNSSANLDQQWQIVPRAGGTVSYINKNGLCLDVTGQTTPTGNPQLEQNTCDLSVNQSFTMTWAG